MLQLPLRVVQRLYTHLLLLCLFHLLCTHAATTWDYDDDDDSLKGPSFWHEADAACGTMQPDERQSPVHINMAAGTGAAELPVFDSSLGALSHGSESKAHDLLNTGNGLTMSAAAGSSITLSGGPLGLAASYAFERVDFHWGRTDTTGSEHVFNGRRFPLEVQLVYWDIAHASYAVAKTKPQGLAIVSVLFRLDEDGADNAELGKITSKLAAMSAAGATGVSEALDVSDLLPTATPFTYFTYEGSLTQPSCEESVVWILSRHTSALSITQLDLFRGLERSVGRSTGSNFRPLQPANGRLLRSSFDFQASPGK